MAGFGQGGSVNMSPTASFLNRTLRPMRSSMAGADAIAPPSRVFAKAPRKGIASLPSPKPARGPQFMPIDPRMAMMDEGAYAHGDPAPDLSPGEVMPGSGMARSQALPMVSPVLGSTRPYPRGMDPMELDPMQGEQDENPGIHQLQQLKEMFPDVERQLLPNELRDQLMMSRAQQGVSNEDLNPIDAEYAKIGRRQPVSSLTPESFDAYRMKALQDQFRQSVTNKQQFDHLTNQAWNRDDRDARYDEGIAKIANPLLGAFMGKGSRAYLDADSAAKLKGIDSHRNARVQERYAQQRGDNEMNDLLMELDPNTPKNMDARRGRNQGYMNSISSMNSSIDRGENYDSLGQHRMNQDANAEDKLSQAAEKMNMTKEQFLQSLGLKRDQFNEVKRVNEQGNYSQQGNIRLSEDRNKQTAIRDENSNKNNQGNLAARNRGLDQTGARDEANQSDRIVKNAIAAGKLNKDGMPTVSQAGQDAAMQVFNPKNPTHISTAREILAAAKAQLPGAPKEQIHALASKLARARGLNIE